MKWSENEIEILKQNYECNGVDYIKMILPDRTKKGIVWKVGDLGLKVNRELYNLRISRTKLNTTKPFNLYKVNPDIFLNIDSKEISYILGFLWADGYIRNDCISMWLKKDDSENIKHIFDSTGIWNNYYRKLKGRKEQMSFHTHNKYIFNFLVENDYLSKSYVNQSKILSLIPNELKHYFFRGYFDGDGSIWMKNNQCIMNITSTYEQDWSVIEELFNNLDIRYTTSCYDDKNRKSKCSRIVTQNMNGIVKFFNYIYQNDDMGLKRKLNTFLKIKVKYDNIVMKNKKIKENNSCTHCESKNFITKGNYKNNKKRYMCKDCNRTFIGI